jgi:RNA polymerase sigma-70 factor (ECF subfamily)
MNEPSDDDLLQAWRAGDAVAGNALVRRHFSTLYRFFRSRIDHDVADLVQKTFLGCVEARDRVPAGVEFRVYALGIARKQLLMLLRKMERQAKVMETRVVSAAAPGTTPSGALTERESQRRLLAALRGLPLDLQLILELHYWEEMRLAQIAPILEIPEGTVKSRLHRARRCLLEQLQRGDLAPAQVESTMRGLETWADRLRAERDPPAAGE